MNAMRFPRGLALLLTIALAACAIPTEKPPPVQVAPPPVRVTPSPPPAVDAPPPVAKPKPPAPPSEAPLADAPKEPPRNLGVDELAKGIKSYEDGDYGAAQKQFQAALDLGLVAPAQRATAHKHLAFIACVAKRIRQCRIEFRKAFAVDPAFELKRSEAGHPTWGPVFRSVKTEVGKSNAKAKPADKSKSR
ncbi:MAG TPA: TssQ family T6SS-associated lipoprotein [Casimicrobiaceae bacterium]|nr:TssQ family T6SS-associated lipoprotein [Casimicrobiaceae bacterium]